MWWRSRLQNHVTVLKSTTPVNIQTASTLCTLAVHNVLYKSTVTWQLMVEDGRFVLKQFKNVMFLFLRNIRVMRLVSVRYVANTSHRYCVNFIGCRSDDELNSRWPAWYTKCCQAKYLAIWLTIFISPQKVLLAPSGFLQGESALSLVFTVVLVTDVLLQLDHVSETTYLPVCETRKSAAQNLENNWKHWFQTNCGASWLFDYCTL